MGRHKRQDSGKSHHMRVQADLNALNPSRIYEIPEEARHLDPTQLAKLEQDFRTWSESSSRKDIRCSRKRILLIFLLIRYTGARLHEVLALDLKKHIDVDKGVVRFGNSEAAEGSPRRDVQISRELTAEVLEMPADPVFAAKTGSRLMVDEGHVRRKFYERAVACNFAQELGSPNAIRRARAVELMQRNVPLPVVQRILGHSTPNLTASLVAFSDDEIQQVARHFVERESRRKTSARNAFFGKIRAIRQGDIQSQVELVTMSGDVVATIITNNSLKRLGLRVGALVTAEVKAPWVVVQKSDIQPESTAENLFRGNVARVTRGKLTSELIVRIHDGTELCSVVTEHSRRKLGLKGGEPVWVMFNSFAVTLHIE
ncbi:MAG: TOBE domain-containing protein [Pseudomonadota bacterium]